VLRRLLSHCRNCCDLSSHWVLAVHSDRWVPVLHRFQSLERVAVSQLTSKVCYWRISFSAIEAAPERRRSLVGNDQTVVNTGRAHAPPPKNRRKYVAFLQIGCSIEKQVPYTEYEYSQGPTAQESARDSASKNITLRKVPSSKYQSRPSK
jgi:hypothetical protein